MFVSASDNVEIEWDMHVKIDVTKVTYFGNTRSKVIFVWFINQQDDFILDFIF